MSELDMEPKSVADHVSLAVIATELRHVKEAVERIDRSSSSNVERDQWQQRNTHVDDKFMNVLGQIAQMRTDFQTEIAKVWAEINSKKVSWTAVAALVISGTLALITVIPLIRG
jgi:leucyl aminopeptidase (aminopeptidase T)